LRAEENSGTKITHGFQPPKALKKKTQKTHSSSIGASKRRKETLWLDLDPADASVRPAASVAEGAKRDGERAACGGS